MTEQALPRELTLEEQAERKEALSNWRNEPNTVLVVSGQGTISSLEDSFEARESFRMHDHYVQGTED